MSVDPGISPRADSSAGDTSEHEIYRPPLWATTPRWTAEFGAGIKPPMTVARTEAIAKKRAWDELKRELADAAGDAVADAAALEQYNPLAHCLSGNELLAERSHQGDGASFADERRQLQAAIASSASPPLPPRELVPRWRLRWPHRRILAAIAYAMLSRCKLGLVATADELGELLGLRVTAIGDAMRRLVAIGYVRRDPTFGKFFAVSNQRANLWRLTTLSVAAFGLHVPRSVRVPVGVVDPAWRPRTRIARTTPRNPEAIPDSVLSHVREEHASFRNGPRPVEAVSPAPPAIGSVFSLPAAPHVPSQPGSADETCSLSSRLSEPESGGASAAPHASSGREQAAAPPRMIAGPDERRRLREQRELDRRRRDDEEFVKTIRGAWESRGIPLTVNAQIALDKLKNGGGS